jgi:hypothetical protein
MMKKLIASLILGTFGCQPPAAERETPAAESFAEAIAKAHARDVWAAKDAIRSDIVVRFGEDTILEGRMLSTTSMSRTRLDLASGAVAIWDGETAWVSPPDAAIEQARFHVLTWPYFLSAPMKLQDPGTRLEPLGQKPLRGESHETARLTFEPGVGDTPDDWYIVYKDLETDRLKAMAYIVTFGTTAEEAEKEPHAITYDEFVVVEGVPIPTKWTFWMWSESEGIHGEPIGGVTLASPAFVSTTAADFAVPENARSEGLPPRTASQ